jgi:lipopolysaccharide export LptBFGC system permease protein LptF
MLTESGTYIFDITNTVTLLLLLVATVLVIFLARELKKSYVVAIPLVAYLGLLIMHVIQMLTLDSADNSYLSTLSWCIVVDFLFVLMTFISYLWVDDLEAKRLNKKSIDSSLDWFWKNV